MPIVGTDAVSLYSSLSNKMKMNIKSISVNELTSFLCISLNDLLNAKKKLEAVGLMSTYSNIKAEKYDFSVVLFSPKSPKKFFNDIVLKGLLEQRIGHDSVKALKEFFKMHLFDKSTYQDVSANLTDVFSVDFDSSEFTYDSEKNEILFDFISKNSTLKFDFTYFFTNFTKRYDVDENLFTKEDKNSISSLANLYGYNEDLMMELVVDCFNTAERKLDVKKLSKICYHNQISTTVNKKTRKVSTISDSKSPLSKKIKYMEECTPYQYLKLKQNNSSPVQSDMNILSYLASQLNLNNGVINALVDYVLEKYNNTLSRKLLEKIGASLVREGVETAFDAMNYLNNFNKPKEVINEGSAAKIEEKEEKIPTNDDSIWDVLKEIE